MRVDFYHLTQSSAEDAVAQIAQKALGGGQRMLVVAEGRAKLERFGEALWAREGTFLANGVAGGVHDQRQPVLLSEQVEPANGAQILALADGEWRESDGFSRVLFFFDGSTIEPARARWRELKAREGAECHYWKQEGGRWIEAG
ncbi:DNA polymerase III subunit chi [Novosphingobium sp. MW5]|nr:DNA polymerase III subunit chi [Novosphingobium sp. MW5]